MTAQPTSPAPWSRRHFLLTTGAVLLAPAAAEAGWLWGRTPPERRIVPCGPGAKYTPKIRAAFVRRQGEYGLRWPGAVYDGAAARRDYTAQLRAAEKEFGLQVDLRPEPIYSAAEADAWLAEARDARPDGLLVLLLDRQDHAWPTAAKAAAAGIPTVVFAPLGAAFTINTAPLAGKPGVYICSTSDFAQARCGLKMLRAGAKLRAMRYLVIRGNERQDTVLEPFGMQLRYLPARDFVELYRRTPTGAEIEGLATAYRRAANRMVGASRADLLNGIKSYVVARQLLEREQADGITMDCLGALGRTDISLPCIAWSRLLDQGIPAACEADLGAAVTQSLVQLLFDRPGFQQDPVAETAKQCLIGAHCSCPTRLDGFDRPPLPFHIAHHHGNRDAVPITQWRAGQRITIADMLLPGETKDHAARLLIGTGSVVENVPVPPHGGCVVSVMVKLDTQPDLLAYPGFHQLFFHGDGKAELLAYARLFSLQAVVA